MAKDVTSKTFKDEETGITYQFALHNFYSNFGGSVFVTPVKNAGKENEKVLPGFYASDANVNENTDLADPAVIAQLIADHPEIKDQIDKIFVKVIAAYRG